MIVIHARNVNDAYMAGLRHLCEHGQREHSRSGDVMVSTMPVTTVYDCPNERVLFNKQRDANPFFHLFESLWMLAGRNDATWLDQFVKDFSSRFAEPDGIQHGAYGFRWRQHFEAEGGGLPPGWTGTSGGDQLVRAVALLKANPANRQVVITMWDPIADMGVNKRDVPCNTHVYLRVRYRGDEREYRRHGIDLTNLNPDGSDLHIISELDKECVLDITVCCRSNDAIWGAYGANAVHFSMLQEYLAAQLGVGIGRYYQVSNNFHAYIDVLNKLLPLSEEGVDVYGTVGRNYSFNYNCAKMVTVPEAFDEDLQRFMNWTADPFVDGQQPLGMYANQWFSDTAMPLFWANRIRQSGGGSIAALRYLDTIAAKKVSYDWGLAASMWLRRRVKVAAA